VTGLIDTGLDFYRQVLDLRGYRQELLAADIANASTPQFRAVDLDFREALGAATREESPGRPPSPSTPRLLVDNPRHQTPQGGGPDVAAAAVKYQVGNPVTLDGNSVDLNREKAAAGENAVQYEAAAAFAAQTIRMLTLAINGSGSQQSGGA
jgi:flagellar basal-body rod protein FlgB